MELFTWGRAPIDSAEMDKIGETLFRETAFSLLIEGITFPRADSVSPILLRNIHSPQRRHCKVIMMFMAKMPIIPAMICQNIVYLILNPAISAKKLSG